MNVVAGPVQLPVLLVAEVDAVEPVGGGERLPPGHKHLWHLQWLLVWWYDDGASSPPPSCFPLTGATLFTTLSSQLYCWSPLRKLVCSNNALECGEHGDR